MSNNIMKPGSEGLEREKNRQRQFTNLTQFTKTVTKLQTSLKLSALQIGYKIATLALQKLDR